MTEPLTARIYVRGGVKYLRLDGSHDALEAWVPVGMAEPIELGTHRGSLTVAEGRAFLMVARDGLRTDVVDARTLIITPRQAPGTDVEGAPDRSALLAATSSLVPEQAIGDGPVASGDLAPYVNAVPGNLVKYLRSDGKAIQIHTFPGHHLDPILEFFSPEIQQVDVAGHLAYVFDNDPVHGATVATDGPSGDLVIVSAPTGGIELTDLSALAGRLVER